MPYDPYRDIDPPYHEGVWHGIMAGFALGFIVGIVATAIVLTALTI
jgi:hypothetical protein